MTDPFASTRNGLPHCGNPSLHIIKDNIGIHHGQKRSINLIIGPLLFVLFSVLLPSSVFSTFAARSAIGTVAWMAYWWVTGPIDYAVTAFLPIALNALFQMTDMSSVIANYASETILLLLGASIPAGAAG